MKKVLAILVVLLMVPFVSMAATMSDADLAAVTGQSGVTIGIASTTIGVNWGSLTWGDYDGFGTGTAPGAYSDAGYVNILAYPAPMHVSIADLTLTIDVGTDTYSTLTVKPVAVQIGITCHEIMVDAFIADIVLDSVNGAANDYEYHNLGSTGSHSLGAYYSYDYEGFTEEAALGTGPDILDYGPGGTYIDKTLGVFGISMLRISIPETVNITISAH